MLLESMPRTWRSAMADEYSDEEFAEEEAYEAEFDAEDDAQPSQVLENGGEGEASRGAHEETVELTPNGEAEEERNREEERRSESGDDYDAEFDAEDAADGQGELEDDAEDKGVGMARPPEEHSGEEDDEQVASVEGGAAHTEQSDCVSTLSTPLSVAGAIVDEAPPVGRVRSASAPHLELNPEPEVEALLKRRSSSPRMRPAPIRRLSSLGELAPAAPDELEVPTNEVTEEAAAVVKETSAATVPLLVKRPSATPFVPRLPSLREATVEYVVPAEIGQGNGSHDQERATSEDEDDREDESEREDEDALDDLRTDGAHPDQVGVIPGTSDHDVIEAASPNAFIDGDALTVSSNVGEDHNADLVDTGFESDASGGKPSAPDSMQPSNDAVSSPGEDNAIQSQAVGIPLPKTEKDDSTVAPSEPSVSVPTAGTPSGSNHEPQELLLEAIMAEVAVKDSDEIKYEDDDTATRDALNEIDYAVDFEEEPRRETHQLSLEANAIISTHARDAVEGSTGHPVRVEAINMAGVSAGGYDDDAVSDDDDETEVVGGAVQYESDYDEIGYEGEGNEHVEGMSKRSITEVSSPSPAVINLELLPREAPSVDKVRESEENVPPEHELPERKTEVASSDESPTAKVADVAAVPSGCSPEVQVKATQRPVRPVAAKSTSVIASPPTRASSQNSIRRPLRQSDNQSPSRVGTSPVQAEPPKFTPKAPIPRQARRIEMVATTATLAESPKDKIQDVRTVSSAPTVSPATSMSSPGRSTSTPTAEPSAPRRRNPSVYKQKKRPDPDLKTKSLKPVKCPPCLRIDLPHVDKEKRNWLLLNMFRHGDDVTKYEAFIPTNSPERACENVELKRPVSARYIYGEGFCQLPPRGAYSRHAGRKLIARPVDPRLQERERNWVSTTPVDSAIPQYDSILDKYCKTVTSPVVQRRIYETRFDDLSPQLAMVLEKRAFKEWKTTETEGFGAASKSYKTEVAPLRDSSSTASARSLRAGPPQSSSASVREFPSCAPDVDVTCHVRSDGSD